MPNHSSRPHTRPIHSVAARLVEWLWRRWIPFGKVTVYRQSPRPSHVALFISGDGGWNLGVVDMARELMGMDALGDGMQQITAIGGTYDNGRGFFCRACGEEFFRTVGSSSGDASVSERKKTPAARRSNIILIGG